MRAYKIAAAIVVGSLFGSPAEADDTATALRALKARLDATEAEVRSLKAQLKSFQSKGSKPKPQQSLAKKGAERARAEDTMASEAAKAPAPSLPFFVDVSRGFRIESLDHANSFRIGGRIYVDGGGSSQPEQGLSSIVNVRQARLEVEGKALNFWNYKLQYDFTASNTTKVGVIGGIRDAYVAVTYFDPITFQVGHFYEPVGLEWTNSKNTSDFLERAMVFTGPLHHLGFAALARGENWSLKGGVFSTSLAEKSLQPSPATPVIFGVPSQAGWVATGGGQYVDFAGRATFAPILAQDRLLHLGVSGRYHRPNDSTATNDGALAPGNSIKTESNILKENLLGTPDLSCGSVSFGGNPPTAGKCVRDMLIYGGELALAYGPFSIQSEYLGVHYDRNNSAILLANAAGNYAPGGSRLNFNGYYVYGTWFLTGESRAAAYQLSGFNPATFGQIDIRNRLSAGGLGAWELTARLSAINLNNGPYAGSYFSNLIAAAQGNQVMSAFVANSNVLGGREEDMTLGLNWYPDPGFRVMANWVRVMHLTAPWDRAYLNNAHPNTLLMRVQADW
jgi:phosphate-selective porin OprO/OprP